MSEINYSQIKVGSKVKIYNMHSKRIKTVKITEVVKEGKRWRAEDTRTVWSGDIEAVVQY